MLNDLNTARKRMDMLESLGFKIPVDLQRKYNELIKELDNIE